MNDRTILSRIPETNCKSNNRDVVSDVSEIRNGVELTAAMKKLKTEEELMCKLIANSDFAINFTEKKLLSTSKISTFSNQVLKM